MPVLTKVHLQLPVQVHSKLQVDCSVKNGKPFNLTLSKLISFQQKRN